MFATNDTFFADNFEYHGQLVGLQSSRLTFYLTSPPGL